MPKSKYRGDVPKPNRYIFWICSVSTCCVWFALICLTIKQLEFSKQPIALSSAADQELAVKPWRERVSKLEATITELQHTVKQRDDRIMQLQLSPGAGLPLAASGSVATPNPSDVRADASGTSGGHPGNLLRRSAENSLNSLPEQGTNLAATPPPSAVPHDPNTCFYQDNLDYPAIGKEEVVPNLNPKECCELCGRRNREGNPCAVAVISARSDNPPNACWLKDKVAIGVNKIGVKACWPPGHPRIPDAPPSDIRIPPVVPGRQGEPQTAPKAENLVAEPPQHRADHLKTLSALTASYQPSTLLLRADAIRGAVKHVWSNYMSHAWGFDELKPMSGSGKDGHFRHAITMVDSLDTLWIMGMKDEFNHAKQWLSANFVKKITVIPPSASLFETHIRTFGGLLSAYDLSKDTTFLDLALPLANKIVGKINGNGIAPYTFGGGRGGMGCNSIVESGTLQLEMRYLSHVTGDRSYAEKADRFYETISRHDSLDGLYPNCFMNGKGKITFGADGDSFYEYLVKVWLQGGRQEEKLFKMYENALEGLEKHLTSRGDKAAGEDDLTFVNVFFWNGKNAGAAGRIDHEMEHLTCFIPGWIALGLDYLKEKDKRKKLAEEIGETCWQMYKRQPTGIGPERVKKRRMDLSLTDTKEYILRPEAAEGWWYLHELIPDPKYREWGWDTFVAFEKWLWVEHGYASLKDVSKTNSIKMDRMESFFVAETLKYLFLLQDPDHDIHLDKYIFNTEAHPLSILSRAPMAK